MRFESNTIGNVEASSEDDILRAFESRESYDIADWPGNVYALLADDGTVLSAVSGSHFKDFALAITDPNGTRQEGSRLMLADEVLEIFIKFRNGDRTWISAETWRERPTGMLQRLLSRVFSGGAR